MTGRVALLHLSTLGSVKHADQPQAGYPRKGAAGVFFWGQEEVRCQHGLPGPP